MSLTVFIRYRIDAFQRARRTRPIARLKDDPTRARTPSVLLAGESHHFLAGHWLARTQESCALKVTPLGRHWLLPLLES
jgi:hypothetical protein